MPSTTTYRQGDIVLVSFPFTDLSSTKRRPALVISPDSFNVHAEDVILGAITSHLAPDRHSVDTRDFREGRLPKPSVVKLSKIFTIHSDLIVKKVCSLKRDKLDTILKKIRDFFS
jgi:mRNA interferase MazF